MADWENGRFSSAIKWMSEKLALIGSSLILIMIFSVVREVIGRYFFASPSDWSIELQCYLLVAMVYLAGSYTEMVEGHIRMEMLYGKLSGKRKLIVDILIYMVSIFWTGTLFWQGWKLALHSYLAHSRSSEAMGWPLFPSQMMIPIGTLLLGLMLICKLFIALSKLFERRR